jgi:hypothetical protein
MTRDPFSPGSTPITGSDDVAALKQAAIDAWMVSEERGSPGHRHSPWQMNDGSFSRSDGERIDHVYHEVIRFEGGMFDGTP